MRLAFDVDVELDGVVELGQRAAGELDVDHRAGDADDAAVLAAGLGRGWLSGRVCFGRWSCRVMLPGVA